MIPCRGLHNFRRLIAVVLPNAGLRGTLPSRLVGLPGLTRLDLSGAAQPFVSPMSAQHTTSLGTPAPPHPRTPAPPHPAPGNALIGTLPAGIARQLIAVNLSGNALNGTLDALVPPSEGGSVIGSAVEPYPLQYVYVTQGLNKGACVVAR
jgi:hypothetical protein